ncbi:MAG: FHA domain-containing protein [Planctomycetaceae bacterium]
MTTRRCNSYMLWIDGVGAWQLCVGDTFVIGAPSFEEKCADIALLANVSRRHATVSRQDENWSLQAHQHTSVSGKTVHGRCSLRSGDQICLADRVRLGFRIPSVLSSSAVVDFESDHRPSHSVDGIILMSDHCLLGPRKDHHICCPEWPELVVLFHQQGRLMCRSKAALKVNDRLVKDSEVLNHGSVVSGDELRFRVEQLV